MVSAVKVWAVTGRLQPVKKSQAGQPVARADCADPGDAVHPHTEPKYRCLESRLYAAMDLPRDYLARKGNAPFLPEQLIESRCNVLGYALKYMTFEGSTIPPWFLQVELAARSEGRGL